jgi:hypothetical protein
MKHAADHPPADPFSDFINHYLNLDDEDFTPIEPPAPTDPRWHYGRYRAASAVKIYSQPNVYYDCGYALRPSERYAHALLRYLPDVRPGWTAVALSMGNPMIGYVRNEPVSFRRSSGIYEYMLTFAVSAQIVIGLSVLIFLYTMPRRKAHVTNPVVSESSAIEQYVERFVARLEHVLQPLE